MSNELNEAFVREATLGRLTEQVRAVGTALPGTEAQIAQLISHEFQLGVGSDGLPALTAKSGKPAAEVIAAKLADPSFRHFAAAPTSQAQARFADELRQGLATSGIVYGLSGGGRTDPGAVGLRGQHANRK